MITLLKFEWLLDKQVRVEFINEKGIIVSVLVSEELMDDLLDSHKLKLMLKDWIV